MRTVPSLALLVPAALLPVAPARAQAVLTGPFSVEVNALGVLTGTPAGGLAAVDGPALLIPEGCPEWMGVSFDVGGVHHDGVAEGLLPDWAGRTPLAPYTFAAGPDTATAIARIATLEVRTDFWFDAIGPYFVGNVTLVNHGAVPIENVLLTREWRSAAGPGWSFPPDLAAMAPPSPPDICRRLWMPDNLPPGGETAFGFSYCPPGAAASPGAAVVPLVNWTGSGFPIGIVFNGTNGISWGDYDADGYPDVFACQSARLWRNLAGAGWQLVADFDQAPGAIVPSEFIRYGASFGDYDENGKPDLAFEPRSNCFHLLANLGPGAVFAEVATAGGTIISQPCGIASETACWADVDGDADLDLFLPVYPPSAGSVGNFFWTNLGPTGIGGAYHFVETSAASGLDNPPASTRPEGAQFCDVDADGDADLFSNATIYQNRSTAGVPDFDALNPAVAGIPPQGVIDEGAAFLDYDMDGDFDLAVVYSSSAIGARIWENRGDGAFFFAGAGVVQSPGVGLDLGLSAEDWDNDGDVDFTTRQIFRRNQFVETGTRLFTVAATTTIPSPWLTSATPAWCDFDKDGDLDCALGNWTSDGHFMVNTTYGPTTAFGDRRFVRVRVLRDSAAVPAGLETEYGASVEVRVLGPAGALKRKRLVSSSAGYLNQSEYTLHFALPADPFPADPAEDLRFDVAVDFPNLETAGVWRVDRLVHPALGNLDLADLANREIAVFRSGRVVLNGVSIPPSPGVSPLLPVTAGGLALSTVNVALPVPTSAPTTSTFVGLDLDTLAASGPVRVKEVVLDGEVEVPVACGGFNAALWDVTVPSAPDLLRSFAWQTSDRNRRTPFPVEFALAPGRHFRFVVHVKNLRSTTIAGPVSQGPITVHGGFVLDDLDPCGGGEVAAAALDSTKVYLAFRFSPDGGIGFGDLGNGLAGTGGTPLLQASGSLLGGETFTLALAGALPKTCACLVLGLSVANLPAFGGILVPAPDFIYPGLEVDNAGALQVTVPWPKSVPAAATGIFQMWVLDASGPQGLSASNAVSATAR